MDRRPHLYVSVKFMTLSGDRFRTAGGSEGPDVGPSYPGSALMSVLTTKTKFGYESHKEDLVDNSCRCCCDFRKRGGEFGRSFLRVIKRPKKGTHDLFHKGLVKKSRGSGRSLLSTSRMCGEVCPEDVEAKQSRFLQLYPS